MILSLIISTYVTVVPCLGEMLSLLSHGLGNVLSVESNKSSKLEFLFDEGSGCLREESAEKNVTQSSFWNATMSRPVKCCFYVTKRTTANDYESVYDFSLRCWDCIRFGSKVCLD